MLTVAELVAELLDLALKLWPDGDMHSQLDAAMVRRAKALKATADDLAFGPEGK